MVSAITFKAILKSRFTDVVSSAASPETLTSCSPLRSIGTGTPGTSLGSDKESVATPFFITDGDFISVTGIPSTFVITLTLFSSQITSIPDITTFIFFILSARIVTFFSPSGKLMPLNSWLYPPSLDTGNETVNDEPIHTASFGVANPDIVTSSPCSTSSGTLNSFTSPLATVKEQDSINSTDSNFIMFLLNSITTK
ncbi:MAG: hypothetical protein C4B56_00390 [Candidatus Methanophagaceae archaeon]|nr:MAG: hypothetical protein C4B56_00390 [Methanophagales archaeon]